MSLASVASQIRVLCARSNACKLGSPVITPTPLRPTRRASDSRRTLDPPSCCVHYSAIPQSLLPAWSRNASPSGMPSQLAVRQTAGSRSFATVFSSSKTDVAATHGRGKMRQLSVRFLPVLKPDSAISPLLLLCRSFPKLAASGSCRQDGVQISLTVFRPAASRLDKSFLLIQRL